MGVDWQLVKALFDEVTALAPYERLAFLRAVTVDEALRAEVRSLIEHDLRAEAGGVLAQPAALDGSALPESAGLKGQRLGAWVVTGVLGQGGMGEVLRARRADGAYEGEAAILKRGT